MDTIYSTLVSIILKITGAKYRQECFPGFISVKESVLSILNTKTGTSYHMELLHKSGQLSNEVIVKAPYQIGGENSHVTDPGKPESSHFTEMNNRDSMPSADRASKAGKASLGKPKGGSTECYVLEEVNPVDKMPLSEKGSPFANTKKKLQLSWSSRAPCLGCISLQESSGFLCFPFLWHFFHRNHDSCSAITFFYLLRNPVCTGPMYVAVGSYVGLEKEQS